MDNRELTPRSRWFAAAIAQRSVAKDSSASTSAVAENSR